MPSVGPRPSTPPACGRPDLARRLTEWDSLEPRELDALEAHAASCPRCGPELELLRRADAWLAGQAPPGSGGPCPDPDALYAAAGGPGAEPLPAAERAAIDEHLTRCAECAGFAATLRSRPPSPLLLEQGPDLAEQPVARRPWRLRLVPVLAAAAGLLLALALWQTWRTPGAQAGGGPLASTPRFPQAELLRGDLGGPLLYPRSAVLAREGGELLHPLEFELEPQDGASSYRIELTRRADEEPVLSVDGTGARVPTLLAHLEPGAYTWEAWAVVHGLDVLLGRRDFEVRHDTEALGLLAGFEALPEPPRSERALALLFERGFFSDARAWARTLPPSPERDAFLQRSPGR